MSYQVLHYINGKAYAQASENTQPIFNPATGKKIGIVCLANQETVNLAVQTANQAYPNWSNTPYPKRAAILFAFRELLIKNQHGLAQLVTNEHGKTLDDAKGSIARGIEVVELHCGILQQMQGTITTDVARGVDCATIRQPLGVCVGISPFNFPVMVPIWMLIPAIATGNTFILKPSEQNPSAALRLLELLSEAGLPEGVANCLQGDKSCVESLITHPDVKAVTAVASTPVAESVYRQAIMHDKRAHTFASAKNHAVVMPDADIPQAAQLIVGAAYGSAGERCMAISVVLAVGEDTADALIKNLKPLISTIRIDDGNNVDSEMGPLISAAHRKRVIAAIDTGVEQGAELVIDGRNFKHSTQPDGYFLGPSLFDNVTTEMSIYQEEIFGPVLVILRVKSLDEAIDVVNRHEYGNGTAIFTRDGYSARHYSHNIQVGMVGVNIPIPVPIASHPFGGWKRSSFGDIFMHGMESIHFYTRLKSITSKWPVQEQLTNAFNMPTHDG